MSLYERVVEDYVGGRGPKFKVLKKCQVKLSPEERKLCMDRKAVWNFHLTRDRKTGKVRHNKTPAVFKSVLPGGETWFTTNTHRAYNTTRTLKGTIARYHNFIKGTA